MDGSCCTLISSVGRKRIVGGIGSGLVIQIYLYDTSVWEDCVTTGPTNSGDNSDGIDNDSSAFPTSDSSPTPSIHPE